MERDSPERPDDALSRKGPLTGREIGDFIIGEQLGKGGHGVVYRATQAALSREVVIKVLRERSDQSSEKTQRFLREAQLAAQLDHPYAAHVYAFGAEPDGLLWIAMELVRGTPLKEMLKTYGSLPLARFVPLLDKLCEVVYTAHQQGMVHRDIKPSNVIVISRAGRFLPKLLDFGIARLVGDPDDGDEDGESSGSSSRGHASGYSTDDEALLETGTAELQPISISEIHDVGLSVSDSDVTQRGDALGSPPYMAPEQWISASRVDARTDQYALAVLAYEALTGRRPFHGPNVMAVAMAHASKPVPSLGQGFTPALDQVFVRALAKKSIERYGDVLEFARAFRSAARLEGGSEPMPRLDPEVREMVLARAPQPIADAVALLEAARGPQSALRAVHQVTQVVVRLLGLTSMAASSRIGTGEGDAGRAALTALRRLRREHLATLDWFDLARTLIGPFASQPDLHPVPEMVLLLIQESESPSSLSASASAADSRPQIPMATRALVERLAALGEHSGESVSNGESQLSEPDSDELNAVLADLLPMLARLLKRVAFLSRYRLVISRGEHHEAWMGTRRSLRPPVEIRGADGLRDGEVSLATRDGEYLLRLSPLVQLMTPAPGAMKEVFLFDGPSRFGARLIAFPVGFERHDNQFWPWYRRFVAEEARELDGDVTTSAQVPYMGLTTFSPADADKYFGREIEVDTFVNRLRVRPFLAVVGPSGAGKSSFVQAGVIPALGREWTAITVRPGPAPLAQLAAALEREGVPADELRARSRVRVATLGRELRRWADERGRKVVLVIDQFEELLTLGADDDERALYARALMAAVRSVEDPVRVVLTLRDDFLVRVQALPALRDELSHSLQIVSTPPPDELERILIEPAKRAGYEFEDEKLPKEMVVEVADEPGALALLSFTASKLWEARDRQDRQLTRKAYLELDGVGGALAQHAETTLKEMPQGHRVLVREVFRQVTTGEGTRAVLTRAELGQLLGQSDEADDVVERLINARLLVASEGQGGEDRIEVIHEALLRSWPRLVTWQREDAENVRLRDQLRAAARQWNDRGRPRGLLWRGDVLLEYRVWRARYPGGVTEVEKEFAAASLHDETRGRRLRRVALMGFVVALIIGLVVVYHQRETAEQARSQAEQARGRAEQAGLEAQISAERAQHSMLALYIEQGRQSLLDGDPMDAFVYLHEARKEGADTAELHFMLARAMDSLDGQIMVLPGHDGIVASVDITADGSRVMTGGVDNKAVLWDGDTGERLHVIEDFGAMVLKVEFDPEARNVAMAIRDGRIEVRDVATGQPVWSERHGKSVMTLAYSPDGRKIATGSSDATIRVWDAASGKRLGTLRGHEGSVLTLAWHPGGAYLVSGAVDRSARVWNVAAETEVTRVTGRLGLVRHVTVSPDGRRAASVSFGGEVQVFSLDGQRVRSLAGHTRSALAAHFSPDSRRLVSASEDGTAKIWDAATGELLSTIEGHASGVTFVRYTPDGTGVLTSSRDGTTKLWSAATGALLWTHVGHEDAIWTAALAASGDRLVTASMDGTARVWDPRKTGHRWAAVHDTPLEWMAATADGQRIATLERRGRVRVRRGDGGSLSSFDVGPGGATRLALRPDGARLITSAGRYSSDPASLAASAAQRPDDLRRVMLWDVNSGTSLGTLEGHGDRVYSATYSPDGAQIVTASLDGTARIWDAGSRTVVRTLRGHEGQVWYAEFDPSGRRIVTAGDDKTARIWNADTGEVDQSLTGHTLVVEQARFSADGAHVITAGNDKLAKIWSVADGELVATLKGHASQLSGAVLEEDQQFAITASHDGSINVWSTASRQVVWSIRQPIDTAIALERVPVQPDAIRVLTGAGRVMASWSLDWRPVQDEVLRRFATCRVARVLVDGRTEQRAIDHEICRRQR